MAFPVLRRTLENGLRVVVSPDHATPSVAVCLWYDVGARDEVAGKTGFAHLFEHLMFQGSRNVPNGDHFATIQSIGGQLNGTTSFDRTNYFETVPVHALSTALWLEADRMGTLADALDLPSLDNQRDVVKNERRQRYDNVPYGTMYEQLIPLLVPTGHPYDHMPIGSMEDLDAASLEDAIGFWRQWYGPNNAVLSLVGDVEAEAAFELVEHYFGSIPRIPTPPAHPDGVLPKLAGMVRRDLHEAVPAERLVSAWRIPPAGTDASDALDLAATVLAIGDASRLERRLVRENQSATSVSAGGFGLIGGLDWFMVNATARVGSTLDDIDQVVLGELSSLADAGPSETELERARAQLELQILASLGSQSGRADTLCQLTTFFDDPDRINRLVEIALAPTAADVQAAVAGYLTADERVIMSYRLGEETP